MKMRSLLLTLTGCISSQLAVHAAPEQAKGRDTILNPNDLIRVEVFNEDELTRDLKILPEGEVALPLIGVVEVAGSTVDQAMTKISGLYAKDYLRNPRVTVMVLQPAPRFVNVIGAVANPGQVAIPAQGALDLAAALTAAGGLLQVADKEAIIVTSGGGKPRTYSAAQILNGAAILLHPNDQIAVRRSQFANKTVTVQGFVNKTGVFNFPSDGNLDLLTVVISNAGGWSAMGDPKRVTVNRSGEAIEINLKQMSETGKERFKLLPGDIVIVPKRIF